MKISVGFTLASKLILYMQNILFPEVFSKFPKVRPMKVSRICSNDGSVLRKYGGGEPNKEDYALFTICRHL